MIKTFINRHDLEYFVYAMAKAFYKDADVLAPDTAEHNMKSDSVSKDEDVIEFIIQGKLLYANVKKGEIFSTEDSFIYELTTLSKYREDNLFELESLLEENEELKSQFKDEVRGFIYDTFVILSGNELPWGNLTGIRPTKLYLKKLKEYASANGVYLEDKNCKEAVCDEMKSLYRVSLGKNSLGADIAIREDKIINSVHLEDGYSLYIGIPFCPSTCLYCSFTSNPIFKYKNIIGEYLSALEKEIAAVRDIMKGKYLDTIYIGGGTPTTLEPAELDRLLTYIKKTLPMENVLEFTVEAGRADSITRDKLEVLKRHNVSRISINPQTMRDKTLKLIGRHHDAKAVLDAFSLAKEVGMDNINMDIILGLPGENLEDVRYTFEQIKHLHPESVTVHSLALKRASRMKEYIEQHDISCDMDLDKAMGIATEAASQMNLKAYYLYRQKDMAGNLENTGFAKEGCFGIYNILMMEEVQSIVALGAGSVSKRVFADGHIERCDNSKDINHYLDNLDEMIERKRQLFAG